MIKTIKFAADFTMVGPVVQWIVYGFPEPRMQVRFLPGLHNGTKTRLVALSHFLFGSG